MTDFQGKRESVKQCTDSLKPKKVRETECSTVPGGKRDRSLDDSTFIRKMRYCKTLLLQTNISTTQTLALLLFSVSS